MNYSINNKNKLRTNELYILTSQFPMILIGQ